MTIENKKLDLIHWLSSLTNEDTIQKLYEVKENESNDWFNDLSSEQKGAIDLALAELKSGKYFTDDDVRKSVRSKIDALKKR